MGLHKMYIGTTNFVLSKVLHVDGEIIYPLLIAIILAIVFVALEYPIIIFLKNHFPFMLGKSKLAKEKTN